MPFSSSSVVSFTYLLRQRHPSIAHNYRQLSSSSLLQPSQGYSYQLQHPLANHYPQYIFQPNTTVNSLSNNNSSVSHLSSLSTSTSNLPPNHDFTPAHSLFPNSNTNPSASNPSSLNEIPKPIGTPKQDSNMNSNSNVKNSNSNLYYDGGYQTHPWLEFNSGLNQNQNQNQHQNQNQNQNTDSNSRSNSKENSHSSAPTSAPIFISSMALAHKSGMIPSFLIDALDCNEDISSKTLSEKSNSSPKLYATTSNSSSISSLSSQSSPSMPFLEEDFDYNFSSSANSSRSSSSLSNPQENYFIDDFHSNQSYFDNRKNPCYLTSFANWEPSVNYFNKSVSEHLIGLLTAIANRDQNSIWSEYCLLKNRGQLNLLSRGNFSSLLVSINPSLPSSSSPATAMLSNHASSTAPELDILSRSSARSSTSSAKKSKSSSRSSSKTRAERAERNETFSLTCDEAMLRTKIILDDIKFFGFTPNALEYSHLIGLAATYNSIRWLVHLWDLMIFENIHRDVWMWNTYIEKICSITFSSPNPNGNANSSTTSSTSLSTSTNNNNNTNSSRIRNSNSTMQRQSSSANSNNLSLASFASANNIDEYSDTYRLLQQSPGQRAMNLISAMITSGVAPNVNTYEVIIAVLARNDQFDTIAEVFKSVWGVSIGNNNSNALADNSASITPDPTAAAKSSSLLTPTVHTLTSIAHSFGEADRVLESLAYIGTLAKAYKIDLSHASAMWRTLIRVSFNTARPHGSTPRYATGDIFRLARHKYNALLGHGTYLYVLRAERRLGHCDNLDEIAHELYLLAAESQIAMNKKLSLSKPLANSTTKQNANKWQNSSTSDEELMVMMLNSISSGSSASVVDFDQEMDLLTRLLRYVTSKLVRLGHIEKSKRVAAKWAALNNEIFGNVAVSLDEFIVQGNWVEKQQQRQARLKAGMAYGISDKSTESSSFTNDTISNNTNAANAATINNNSTATNSMNGATDTTSLNDTNMKKTGTLGNGKNYSWKSAGNNNTSNTANNVNNKLNNGKNNTNSISAKNSNSKTNNGKINNGKVNQSKEDKLETLMVLEKYFV